MAGGQCKHCGGEFSSLGSHQSQCGQRLPWVYRRAMPFARRRIKQLGFDQRTHEGRIFRYAVLRYYVDLFEASVAFLWLLGRAYFVLPVDEWFGVSWPFAGESTLNWSDGVLFLWSVWMTWSKVPLLLDYHRHVVTRLEKVASRR